MRIAILDMYNNKSEAHGIRCITDILLKSIDNGIIDIYNIRGEFEFPDMSYDLYIGTGGPGNPLEYNLHWTEKFRTWLNDLFAFNIINHENPKYFFGICHTFQLMCAHFDIGTVSRREKMVFGLTRIKKTQDGEGDFCLTGLNKEFYAADYRYFEVINPDLAAIDQLGFSILAMESYEPRSQNNRALMGLRFSPYIVGFQFHPEADENAMLSILNSSQERKSLLIVYDVKYLDSFSHEIINSSDLIKVNASILPQFFQQIKSKKLQPRSVI